MILLSWDGNGRMRANSCGRLVAQAVAEVVLRRRSVASRAVISEMNVIANLQRLCLLMTIVEYGLLPYSSTSWVISECLTAPPMRSHAYPPLPFLTQSRPSWAWTNRNGPGSIYLGEFLVDGRSALLVQRILSGTPRCHRVNWQLVQLVEAPGSDGASAALRKVPRSSRVSVMLSKRLLRDIIWLGGVSARVCTCY